MRTLSSFVIALLLLAWAPQAHAVDAQLEEARQAFEQAEKSYALGKFDDALKLYEHAYDLKPLPGFLFIGATFPSVGCPPRTTGA